MALPEYDPELVQQIEALEDMLLLSRYDEAAGASAELVQRFAKGGNTTDVFLQRALITTIQANFFTGRYT